jgi:hypothetical protein
LAITLTVGFSVPIDRTATPATPEKRMKLIGLFDGLSNGVESFRQGRARHPDFVFSGGSIALEGVFLGVFSENRFFLWLNHAGYSDFFCSSGTLAA